MSDDTEDKRNVFSIVRDGKKKKDTTPIIDLHVLYKDDTIETIACHYFGESVEIPGLLITGFDDKSVPSCLINLDTIKKIDISQD